MLKEILIAGLSLISPPMGVIATWADCIIGNVKSIIPAVISTMTLGLDMSPIWNFGVEVGVSSLVEIISNNNLSENLISVPCKKCGEYSNKYVKYKNAVLCSDCQSDLLSEEINNDVVLYYPDNVRTYIKNFNTTFNFNFSFNPSENYEKPKKYNFNYDFNFKKR